MVKRYLLWATALGALIAFTFGVQYILLGGAQYIKLRPAPDLAGIISQSLYKGQGQTTLPVINKDYAIKEVKYFDNNTWVVVSIAPLRNQFDPGLAVLQKKSGLYVVVLGPGSAFDSSSLVSMPSDAAQYLHDRKVVYESVN